MPKNIYPFTLHISTPTYKHMCLYPGHKHMCLYPVDIHQSLTKSIRFKITVIPFDFIAYYVRTGNLFHQVTIFVSVMCLKYRILGRIYSNYKDARA